MKCTTEDCLWSKDHREHLGYPLMQVLSHHDKPRKVSGDGIVGIVVDYTRTTKWKCPNGHISEERSVITAKELTPEIPKDVDSSVKRFHRKGFKGHKVNSTYVPDFIAGTNHERHLANRDHQVTDMVATSPEAKNGLSNPPPGGHKVNGG